MPRLSEQKRKKISEQILYYLFSCAPESKFTSEIAVESIRDEEFIKSLLIDLNKKGLIVLVSKNKAGNIYLKRQKWRLSNQVYDAYTKQQRNSNISSVKNLEDYYQNQ